MRVAPLIATSFVLAAFTAACARTPEPATQAAAAPVVVPAPPPPGAVEPAPSSWPVVLVHKSPTCGCCTGWVDHLRAAGFEVQVDDTDALAPIKDRLGVPAAKGACHTAEVGGYFVEGHVPADDIKRLLAERPVASGLAVPGMPMGSPGMGESGGGYTVELVQADGSATAFARH
jgi:hypothetical protein